MLTEGAVLGGGAFSRVSIVTGEPCSMQMLGWACASTLHKCAVLGQEGFS